jgi:hypothetical protein
MNIKGAEHVIPNMMAQQQAQDQLTHRRQMAYHADKAQAALRALLSGEATWLALIQSNSPPGALSTGSCA